MRNPIHDLFAKAGVSVSWMAKGTGLSEGCCSKILSDPLKNVKYETADTIARWIGVDVHTLFHPSNITDKGRKPFSHSKISGDLPRKPQLCPVHNIEMPLTGNCDDCA